MTLIAKMEELFKNPANASKEGVNSLLQEAFRFLNSLKERLESKDAEVQSAAMKEAFAMQSKLREQIEKMGQERNIHPTQMENTFAAAEAAIQAQKNGASENVFGMALKHLQSSLAEPPKKKKPKRVKEWLAS